MKTAPDSTLNIGVKPKSIQQKKGDLYTNLSSCSTAQRLQFSQMHALCCQSPKKFLKLNLKDELPMLKLCDSTDQIAKELR